MKSLLLLFTSCFMAVFSQAQVIHVPVDYPKIQLGINAANPGDTILVAEGTYYEQINFLGKKPLMVASEFLMDGDTSHISKTIIDGDSITNDDNGSIINFISGEDTTSVLCGFTVRNGIKGTKYTYSSNTIRGGGGIFIFSSGARIIHNHIVNNHIDNPAEEVSMGGGIASEFSPDFNWVLIEYNTIDSNSCSSYLLNALGAGISISCNSRINNNVITDNLCEGVSSASVGGAAFFAGGAPDWQADLITIVKNNIIRNNQSIGEYGWRGGSGGFSQCNTLIFSDNTVEQNYGYSFGALHMYNPRTASSVTKNIFKNNKSFGYSGALHIINESQEFYNVMVESNYFISDTGYWGGAIYSDHNPVKLQNNVFSGNHATSNGGAINIIGSYSMGFDHTAILINNSFNNNSSESSGGAITLTTAKPLIFNSVFWNDTCSMQGGGNEIFLQNTSDTVEIAFSNIDPSLISGNGKYLDGGSNINEDPLFMDPIYLIPYNWSPIVDAGTTQYTCTHGNTFEAPAYQINGYARPVGVGYDMGAYDHEAWVFGLQEDSKHALRIYPNPSSSCITIENDCKGNLFIFDLKDQKLLQREITGSSSTLDVSNLPDGLYLVKVVGEKGVWMGKFIKR